MKRLFAPKPGCELDFEPHDDWTDLEQDLEQAAEQWRAWRDTQYGGSSQTLAYELGRCALRS